MCYSIVRAILLADLIEGKENPHHDLVQIDW